jgi:hypothetical protein
MSVTRDLRTGRESVLVDSAQFFFIHFPIGRHGICLLISPNLKLRTYLFGLVGSPFRSILDRATVMPLLRKPPSRGRNCRAAPFYVKCARHFPSLLGDLRGKKISNAPRMDDTGCSRTKEVSKAPTAKIARALKRTEGATRQKAFSLGVSLDTRT